MTKIPDMWDQPHGVVQVDAHALKLQAESHQSGDLLVWTVTYNTSDAPGLYAVRPHSTRHGPRPLKFSLRSPDLMRLRAMLPLGLYRMDRDPADDKVIVETWI